MQIAVIGANWFLFLKGHFTQSNTSFTEFKHMINIYLLVQNYNSSNIYILPKSLESGVMSLKEAWELENWNRNKNRKESFLSDPSTILQQVD